MRVTGGFLAGLDVSFSRHLNVVIGARGAGKTTMLELIRHALGAEHADRKQDSSRKSFLKAVLGSGQVVLDLEVGSASHQLVVDADGRGRDRALSSSILILGQSELEDIAGDPASRVRLLDLRGDSDLRTFPMEEIGSLTTQMLALQADISAFKDSLTRRTILENDRELYRAQISAIVEASEHPLAEDRNAIALLELSLSTLADETTHIRAANDSVADLAAAQSRAHADWERIEQSVKRSPRLAGALEDVATVRLALDTVSEWNAQLLAKIEFGASSVKEEESGIRNKLIPLRARLDEAEAGLGELSARLHSVESQLREVDQVEAQVAALQREYEACRALRRSYFDEAERFEEGLFQTRATVAAEITTAIANNVVVVVQHFGDASEFREVLTDALKGTHTRASVVDTVADRVLPRLLLDFVESGSIEQLAATASISLDQAGRIVSAFNDELALQRLSKVTLLDRVDFLLRDGATEKNVDSLSTGQKCAVTLPIVLSERERSLVLDQPEDHLDNAYLVDHIVTGMVSRTELGVQTIVATHNANIPVLGSAELVVELDSDGSRGAVHAQGRFDEPQMVSAITTLLEGGARAFDLRADFYRKYTAIA